MAYSCKDKCTQTIILTSSALTALVFVWWLSNAILGWVYEFDTKEMVKETVKEMVKEDALKKGQ